MSERVRVYVAGPISKGDLAHNIRQATEAGLALLKAGLAPFVPHLSCYMGGPTPDKTGGGLPSEVWYDMDAAWVAVSDAVLRLPGESVGADLEVRLAEGLGIPVYDSIHHLLEDHAAGRLAKGDGRFHRLLGVIARLHDRKSRDYGSEADPFANVRASQDYGVPAWKGAVLRMGDKFKRLQSFCRRGELANESAQDSLLDISVYSLIAFILYEEAGAGGEAAGTPPAARGEVG